MRKVLITQGLRYLEEGKLVQANHVLSTLVQKYPDCADGHHLLGVIALELGNFDEAYLFVHTALSLSPDNSIFYTSLGNVQLHLHNYTEANAAFIKAIEHDPNRNEYRINLANFYLARNDFPRALQQYNSVLQKNPDNYLAMRGKTISYLFAGENKTALSNAKSLLQDYSFHFEPFYIYGLCLYANNLFDEALSSFDHALDLHANSYEVLTAVAACYHGLGNDNIAETFLHRALSIETNNPAALYLLTCIKYNSGEHKTARDFFLNAIRLDIEFPTIAMQNVEDAVQYCTNTQAQDPLFFLKCSGADYLPMLNCSL